MFLMSEVPLYRDDGTGCVRLKRSRHAALREQVSAERIRQTYDSQSKILAITCAIFQLEGFKTL